MSNKLAYTAIFFTLTCGGCARDARRGEIADMHREIVGGARPHVKEGGDEKDGVKHGITEIGLERTECYGRCPAYTAIISSDGTVRYFGKNFVERKGEHKAKISLSAFNRLAAFIRDSGYMELENTYERPVTDNPTVYTTIVINGQRKVIKNYANAGPTTLWAIEQLIDKLLLEAKWEGDAGPEKEKP